MKIHRILFVMVGALFAYCAMVYASAAILFPFIFVWVTLSSQGLSWILFLIPVVLVLVGVIAFGIAYAIKMRHGLLQKY